MIRSDAFRRWRVALALVAGLALAGCASLGGGSPYGATTIAKADGSRMPSENELAMAHFQGRHVAQIAQKQAAA